MFWSKFMTLSYWEMLIVKGELKFHLLHGVKRHHVICFCRNKKGSKKVILVLLWLSEAKYLCSQTICTILEKMIKIVFVWENLACQLCQLMTSLQTKTKFCLTLLSVNQIFCKQKCLWTEVPYRQCKHSTWKLYIQCHHTRFTNTWILFY